METPGGYSKEVQVDEAELYFLIARFLEGGPCQQAAEVLKHELASRQLLPRRKNWLGEDEQLSYDDAVRRANHVAPDHLKLLCSKLVGLLDQHGCQKTTGLYSLLGSGTTANISSGKKDQLPATILSTAHRHHELSIAFREQPLTNSCQLIASRQISPCFARNAIAGPQFYKGLKKHWAILGHLAPVFCVMFDHTGQCIITGADDDLVKVWSSRTGQLLATLRGHCAEVTDMSLSCDNAMIASGSLDKTVRVWCAQSTAPIAVLTGHQGHVTSVQFSPSPVEEYRYLASTGKDGFLCFWQWLPDSCTFNATAIKFMEKNRMGDQTLCSAFSPGGKFFVTGGTDRIIRVYVCIPGPPTLHAELTGHTDRIMTVQFGNVGRSMFATGSCDGTTRIWRYQEGGWISVVLRVPANELSRMAAETARTGKPDKPQVTMVGWDKTDTYLITAFSPDCNIRVWRSGAGTLLHTLQGHTGEVFVLEAHPTDPRILLSAGHDGLVILWDILAGLKLKTLQLEDEEGTVPCIFDCKFSPDGLMCAAADSSCQLSLFGFGSSQPYEQHPREQFFHVDYRPLMRDRNHFVVDEMSQLPPHLLPPPYLVNIDGHAHPLRYQEAILRLIRPVKQVTSDGTGEELEDYDEYMKKHLAKVKQQGFGFSRAKPSVNADLLPQLPRASNFQEGSRSPLQGDVAITQGDVAITQGDVAITHGDTAITQGNTAITQGDAAITQGNTAITQGNTAITHGSSAQILNLQGIIGGQSSSGPATVGSNTHQDANTSQNDPMLSSNDDSSLYLAAEHSYAGLQPLGASCNSSGSGLQSRGSQTPDASCNTSGSGLQSRGSQTPDASCNTSGSGLQSRGSHTPDASCNTLGSGLQSRGSHTPDASCNTSGSGLQSRGSQTPDASYNASGSGLQSRGSQFLSSVQNQRMVVAVAMDRGKEESKGGGPVEGVSSAGMGSGNSSLVENMQCEVSGVCPQEPATSEMPADGTRPGSGDEQSTSKRDGRHFPTARRLRTRARGGTVVSPSQPSSATANSDATLPASPPPLPPPGGADTNGGPMVLPDDEEPIVNVTDDDDSSDNIRNMLSSLVYSLGLGETEEKLAISLWHNRIILPSMDVAILSSEEARRRELYQREERSWEEENKRISITHTPTPPPQSRKQQHGRALRSGRTLPDPSEEARRVSLESEPLSESEGEESEVEDVWEDESTASSDISDWTTEANIKFISPGKKRNRRSRRPREYAESVSSDEGEGDGDGEEPGPSTRGEGRKESTTREKKPRKRPPASVVDYTPYWPTHWLKITRPQVTPYFPQVGDVVIYCRQGHELYVNAAKEERIHVLKSQKMPWQKYNLLPQEFCQVKNVHYVVGPPTLCSITLALLSPSTTTSVNSDTCPGTSQQQITFTLKYHDMDGMLDFLVLDSVYKPSIHRQWQPDNRFCSLIDNTYWYGTVIKREPFSEDLPNSQWQCYRVLWDDGATDQLSPWDMEPVPQDGEDPVQKAASLMRPTEDALEAWGGEGEEEEVKRVLCGLEVVSELDEAFMFRHPVDLEEEPTYCLAVPFPTDLSTIRERLQNLFYRRKIALLWEVVQLARNATAYNEEDSLIVKHARVLVHTLCKFILTPTCTNPMECYKEEPEGDVETEVNVTVPEVTFLDDTLPPLPPPPSSSPVKTITPINGEGPMEEEEEEEEPQKSSRIASTWVERAEQLLDVLEANENSPPFLEPVDTHAYPDYLQVILRPMDLNTLRCTLLSGQYDCPNSFLSDLRLMFQNAKTYNRRGSMIYKMTTELQAFFEVQVMDFLKSVGSEVVYGTRKTLGRLAYSSVTNSSIDVSTASTNSPVTRRQTRAATKLKLEGGVSSPDEYEDGISVDLSAPATPSSEASSLYLARRETRSMTLRRSSSADGFSMTLRSRETRKRVLEDNDSEEEVTTPTSRRTRKGKCGMTPRKRQRLSSDSEPEDDSGTVETALPTIVTSRGRIVRPTLKLT